RGRKASPDARASRAWMPASASASWPGSAARAGAYSASRSRRRASVSPATKSMTKKGEPSTAASSSHQRTRGTRSPAAGQHRIEGPYLARRAAGQAAEVLDRDRLDAEPPRDVAHEPLGELGRRD